MTNWTEAELIHDARVVFRLVSGKWTLRILAALQNGPRRHNELRRAVQPVHPKVFDETLRRMTEQQLLRREVRSGVPPAVYYAISEPARSLMDELDDLMEWIKNNPSLLRLWRVP
jgi:DNA-binding HxlR family transcriptional regulator